MAFPLTPAPRRQAFEAFQNTHNAKPIIHSPVRIARALLLLLFIVAVSAIAALPGSSAAPSKQSPPDRALNVSVQQPASPAAAPGRVSQYHGFGRASSFSMLFFQSPPETVSTFAANCTTGKTDFNLNDTVCAKLEGAPSGSNHRRVVLVDPDGFIVDGVDVTSSSQTQSFALPSAATGTING